MGDNISVRGPSTGDQGWYDPNLPFDTGFNPILNDHQKYWQVNITDIPEPFLQDRGTVYWLSLFMDITLIIDCASKTLELKSKFAAHLGA